MWPDPSACYRRAEYLQVRTLADGHEAVWDGRRWIEVPRAMDLLARFSTAQNATDVLDQILAGCRARAEGIAVLHSMALLVESGALVAVDGALPSGVAGRWLLEQQREYHGGLLADRVRVEALVDAVRALVKPGDVVIDAGTGSGILAVAAASAGARRVYAIEAGGIGEVAAKVFRDNAIDDRVELIRGDASRVQLPEPADVLMTETIGANPFDEGILQVIRALRRHLVPSARILPRAISVLVAPLEVPANILRAWVPHDDDLGFLRERYGFDLSALALPGWPRATAMPVDRARAWMMTAEPSLIARVSFEAHLPAAVEGEVDVQVTRGGTVNALGLGFDVDLGGGRSLSSWAIEDRSPSWDLSGIRLPMPIAVSGGARLRVTLHQPASGHTPKVTVVPLS